MRNRFGDRWWYNRESGKRLREIMKPGAQTICLYFPN